MKVVTVAEMRRLEAESAKLGIAAAELMENAGRAVTQSMRNILGSVTGKRIVALVGPGNNGGDGLMAARYLADWGASVSIYLAQARPDDDKNFKLVAERDITVLTGAEGMAEMERALYAADAALDAFFGTGQSRAIDGPYKEALDRLAEIRAGCSNLKIFSIDLPSGLNADNGAADPATPRADYTLTLGLPKRGLYQADGAALSGQVVTLDIGIPPRLATDIKTELMDDELMRPLLPPRPPLANKGSFGRALVVAGSANYIGAAYLACAGAARSGAGLVTLAAAQSLVPVVASRLAEAVYIPLPEESPGVILPEAAGLSGSAGDFSAVLVGPGLGQRQPVVEFISRLLNGINDARLVIDADGLNVLAARDEWWRRPAFDAILTPHPGEMARLAGLSVATVQAERIDMTMHRAAAWNKTVVLKGAFSVIASPDGRCRINPFASAALSSAGTGDVLAGVITGFVAQGMELFDAASLGVYMHARAAERVRQRMGEAGVLASDLLPELPLAIKELRG